MMRLMRLKVINRIWIAYKNTQAYFLWFKSVLPYTT